MKEVFNFPNLLSLFRMLLAFPIIYFLQIEKNFISLLLIFVAIITDYFDGYVARLNKNNTEFGKIIDPLADKICVITLIIFLFITGKINIFYFLIVAFRDIIILLGGLHIKIKKGFTITSNWPGKVTVFFTAFYIFLVILNLDELKYFTKIIYYTNILYLFYSFFNYVKNYFTVLKEKNV